MLAVRAACWALAAGSGGLPSCRPRRAHRHMLTAGLRVSVHCEGRDRPSEWPSVAFAEYASRLRGSGVELEARWHASGAKMLSACRAERDKGRPVVALDERGKALTSPQFSALVYDKLEAGGSRLNVVIGGADGLPEGLAAEADATVSLSKMVFTHSMARAVVAEQIYRASEIRKGSAYHRE